MRLIFDEEYEDIDSSIRNYDDNKYCLFIDSAGNNIQNSIIDVHWHEWLEIVYIIDGYMTTITPSGSFEVKNGDIIVIGMQALHKMIGKKGNFRFQCMHINIGFILQHMPLTILADKVFMVENRTKFIDVFSQVISNMNKNDIASQLEYKATLLSLLSLCLLESRYDSSLDSYENNDTISRILFYVSTHYREDISLQHLSNHFGYTTQHISLMFKRYLKTNYYTYLTKLRLDRAKFLLMSSNKRIIDIAYECGFSSEHAFINHFKKWYLMTPSKYRKQNYRT
ncbi:AraC family transcriptional regulator [Thomasclavelia sp.]|uniref:AraC family transcriptional regulator n=1 Tax=Thomasclavelia sp. TaxID=3025757 RepID=UPI0025FE652D|nr:AraC family transcriptional regulator [Thomasclavelia sp.]